MLSSLQLPILGVCLCVYNQQWAYADNCADAVERVLIFKCLYLDELRDSKRQKIKEEIEVAWKQTCQKED